VLRENATEMKHIFIIINFYCTKKMLLDCIVSCGYLNDVNKKIYNVNICEENCIPKKILYE